MFTGIITDIGTVEEIGEQRGRRIAIGCRPETAAAQVGASIACAGVCLTVVERAERRFVVEVSQETLDRTTIGLWRPGTRVNLERALRVGDEMGGHIVSGHVDGVGSVAAIGAEGASVRVTFAAPGGIARLCAGKGSVAVDGVSLTVNGAGDGGFEVNLIPHTLAATTLGGLAVGGRVNLEVDMLARYVARLLGREL